MFLWVTTTECLVIMALSLGVLAQEIVVSGVIKLVGVTACWTQLHWISDGADVDGLETVGSYYIYFLKKNEKNKWGKNINDVKKERLWEHNIYDRKKQINSL